MNNFSCLMISFSVLKKMILGSSTKIRNILLKQFFNPCLGIVGIILFPVFKTNFGLPAQSNGLEK